MFKKKGGHLENTKTCMAYDISYSSNVQGPFMQNVVHVSTSEIFPLSATLYR